MINSWKMLKACQEQDFTPEAAKPTFPPVLTLQLQSRECLLPPFALPLAKGQEQHKLQPLSLGRAAKTGRAEDGGTAGKGATNSPGGRV